MCEVCEKTIDILVHELGFAEDEAEQLVKCFDGKCYVRDLLEMDWDLEEWGVESTRDLMDELEITFRSYGLYITWPVWVRQLGGYYHLVRPL